MPGGEGERRAWVVRVLGVAFPVDAKATHNDALAAWQKARKDAIADLNRLADAVGKLDIPEAPGAVVLLRAIRANLTETPVTASQISELRRYITTDEIIADAEDPNGFGIEVRLRDPLLVALDRLDSTGSGVTV